MGKVAPYSLTQHAADHQSMTGGTIVLGRPTDPVAGAASTSNYIFVHADAVQYSGNLTSLKVYATAGSFDLRKYVRSGSPGSYTYTQTASVSLNVATTGLATFTTADFGTFPVDEGEYLGLHWAYGGKVHVAYPSTADGSGLYQVSGNGTSFSNPALATTTKVQWQFIVTYAQIYASISSVSALTARVTSVESQPALAPATTTLLAYGDSMTQGNGGTPYPSQLATLLGRTVTNRGVGAQRAPDIFSRWGSYPVILPALTIPSSGYVDFQVTAAFDNANPLTAVNSGSTFTCTIAGIAGTLSYLSAGSGYYNYRFTRTSSGTAKSVAKNDVLLIDVSDSRDYATPIFWVGRNSIGLQDTTGASYDSQFNSIMAWHERAIALLKPFSKRFIIMGPSNRNDEYAGSTATSAGAALNGSQSYALIVAIENEMRLRWPRNFVDQRALVVASYDSGSPTDVADFAADRTPTSKRADLLHYNTDGYGIVAAAVQERIALLGY